jgi:hypothetical integral membrane protein (TIGR02206 family)
MPQRHRGNLARTSRTPAERNNYEVAMGVLAVVSPTSYVVGCVLGVAAIVAGVIELRHRPARAWWVCDALAAVLLGDVVAYLVQEISASTFSPRTSLPLSLCNIAVVVAGVACVTRLRMLVEITYFVGLAGTLQAVITPDLSSPFPHLVFFEYLAGHLGIVAAACLLVLGLGLTPRPRAWLRTYVIVAAYTALVGVVDATTGADYMFLRKPPSESTLLSVLGPFPWYIVSAAAVAFALFFLLDLPFSIARHHSQAPSRPRRLLAGQHSPLP